MLLPQPVLRCEAAVWGAAYVLEGSKLGGALLAKAVPDHLPNSYLKPQGLKGAMRLFMDRLDASKVEDPDAAKSLATVVLFEGWRSFPFAFLFLTARIQAIPDTLEEAAVVDGATPTQRFRYIVLPQLLPTIAVLTVLRFIWTFNNFDDIYLLTGGGSGTQVVAVRVYDYLINRGDIGAAAAKALVLAAILAVLVTVYLKLFGRSEEVAYVTTITRDAVERRLFGVLRPLVIAFLLVICLFPFYYMILLSFRPLDAVLQDPGRSGPSPATSTSGPIATRWPRSPTAARGS